MSAELSLSIRRVTLLLAAGVAILACAAPAAEATYAGKPGRIVFALGSEQVDPDLFSIDAESGSILRLTRNVEWPGSYSWQIHEGDYGPTWSPNGGLIAWWHEYDTPPPDPYAYPSSDVRVMTPYGSQVEAPDAPSPTFAPDGSLCGWSFKAHPDIPSEWTCVPQEGRLRKPPYRPKELSLVGPGFSPDRRLHAFVSQVAAGSDVFLEDVGSGKSRQLTFTLDTREFSPAFAPDGSAIAWGAATGAEVAIVIYDLRSGQTRILPIQVDVYFPDAPNFAGMSWGPMPVSCGRRRATQVGTEGPDVIVGTKRADVLAGLGGDDKLIGGKGKDRLCGGLGRDKLRGGPGKDLVKP